MSHHGQPLAAGIHAHAQGLGIGAMMDELGPVDILDTNAGHCRTKIVEAVQKQAATMDYAPAFQMGHPGSFRVATRIAAMLPGDRLKFHELGGDILG